MSTAVVHYRGVHGHVWHVISSATREEQPHDPHVVIGACDVELPLGPDVQYGPAGVNLAVPRAVVQLGVHLACRGEPRHTSQKSHIVQRRAPEGGVGTSGQGRRGGGGAVVAQTLRRWWRQRPTMLTSAPSSRIPPMPQSMEHPALGGSHERDGHPWLAAFDLARCTKTLPSKEYVVLSSSMAFF